MMELRGAVVELADTDSRMSVFPWVLLLLFFLWSEEREEVV